MDTLSTAASAMRWPFRASSDARCISIRRRMPPRASRRSRFTYVRRRGASAPPAGAEMVVSEPILDMPQPPVQLGVARPERAAADRARNVHRQRRKMSMDIDSYRSSCLWTPSGLCHCARNVHRQRQKCLWTFIDLNRPTNVHRQRRKMSIAIDPYRSTCLWTRAGLCHRAPNVHRQRQAMSIAIDPYRSTCLWTPVDDGIALRMSIDSGQKCP